LTVTEFVNRAVGMPWIRWRSDWDACDCFGLIVLYHREVLGVELGSVPQSDIAQGFEAAQDWSECSDGSTCFMAWRNGYPTHCGILLPGSMVLHSEGSQGHPGSVRVSRLAAIRKIYGDLKFYRYSPC